MSIGYANEDFGPEYDPWDDDLYWINQREADDYRNEHDDLFTIDEEHDYESTGLESDLWD